MTTDHNARRERIAEQLFVRVLTSSGFDGTAIEAAGWARSAADKFVGLEPKQTQPCADASPSLLGMAKLVVGIDWAALFREAWCDDHDAGQVPPVVAAAIDNLRDAIKREEARRG